MFEENLRSENGYITEVKRALLRKGFWGQPVRKLVEELRDHFRTKTETLAAQGHPLPEVHRMAAAALGEPQTIATEWSRTLQSASWMTRHPWLVGVMGLGGIWVFYSLSLIAFVQLSGITDPSSTHRPSFLQVEGWLFLINWMPWILGMGLLTWKAFRSPMGWRPLLVAGLALGLATSAWEFTCHFPPHAGSTGNITVEGKTWMSLWAYPLFYCLHRLREIGADPSSAWAQIWLGPGLFKLLFPLLSCLGVRWMITRSSNLTALDD